MTAAAVTKGEATRARVVDVAYDLFLAQGYHGTSMRQIADRAGITMGGIYNHFAGKEAIWQAVLLERHPYHEILPLLRDAPGDTVADYVRNAAELMITALGRRTDLLNLMFIELVEFGGKHLPDLFRTVMPQVSALGQSFGTKQGALRPIPLPLLARSFAGLFISFYITEQMMPADLHALMGDDALDAMVDIYLHGILAE